MKRGTVLLGFLALGIAAKAQQGKASVEKLCGCYNVTFKYAETFSPNKDYKFHERETTTDAIELALPIVNTNKRIVIQHLLVMGDSMVVKHWREDWTYENREQWNYTAKNTWEKVILPAAEVKGKWTQTVWEVSDAPRYQGAATWQVINGHTIWENTTDAPLPRREYTKRSDYNILNRTNRLVLLPDGYNHVQDNKKVLRKDGKDIVIAEEKGLNSYVAVPESNCAEGKKYWADYSGYWLQVEDAWTKLLSGKTKIQLTDGKGLMEDFFSQSEKWKKGELKDAAVVINATLQKHIQ